MAAKNYNAEVQWLVDNRLWTRRYGDVEFVTPERSVELRANQTKRVWYHWEKHIKPRLREAVVAYTAATVHTPSGPGQKVMVKDERSGRWTPRSGLQWPELHDAVALHLQKVISGNPDAVVDASFTATGLVICMICNRPFVEGRGFRGEVGKFALDLTPYGLNPEMTSPDAQTYPAANRQGQCDLAVIQASVATRMMKHAAALDDSIKGTMSESALTLPKALRQVCRFEQLDRPASRCGNDESNVALKKRGLSAMGDEVGLSDMDNSQQEEILHPSEHMTTPGIATSGQGERPSGHGVVARHPQSGDQEG